MKKSNNQNIRVFVTYSWDSEEHKEEVLSFTDYLRKIGYAAEMDRLKSQEYTSIDFTKMMHQAITDNQKVIVVLSKGYKKKADNFEGGVGLEYRLIINDIVEHPKKYILLTFENTLEDLLPINFKGREVIKIHSTTGFESLNYKLQDINEFDFSEVAEHLPTIKDQKIHDFKDTYHAKITNQNATQKKDHEELSVVTISRIKNRVGDLLIFDIYMDGRKLCSINNGKMSIVKIKRGKHVFEVTYYKYVEDHESWNEYEGRSKKTEINIDTGEINLVCDYENVRTNFFGFPKANGHSLFIKKQM